MPQNCSADVQAVVEHVDQVLTTGTADQIDLLKANWGMQNVTHLDDVAAACTPLGLIELVSSLIEVTV